LDVHRGPMTLLTTLETTFMRVPIGIDLNPLIPALYLSMGKVNLHCCTSEVFLDVHGGPTSLSKTFETIFDRVNLSLSHLDLSSGPSMSNLGPLRYLSEVNEP
jgi:hypothetical protein